MSSREGDASSRASRTQKNLEISKVVRDEVRNQMREISKVIRDEVRNQMQEIFSEQQEILVKNSGDCERGVSAFEKRKRTWNRMKLNEIQAKCLKQQDDLTEDDIDEHTLYFNEDIEEEKVHWRKAGCTIMLDGWTTRRRIMINFLVNSTYGTVLLKSIDMLRTDGMANKIFKMVDEVVEEVGEENVVQVVTENAAIYKAVGKMLMKKRKKLYWTPCAAHCIGLMLEDFEKKIEVHKETIASGKKIVARISLLQHKIIEYDFLRPVVARFASSYLTLGCLNEHKKTLIGVFTSDEWKSSQHANTSDVKFIENVVTDMRFWNNVVICLKGAYPLVRLLHLVESNENSAMEFIYEEMVRAKKTIQSAFNGAEKSYLPLWKIIDERWEDQLLRPLHAAGYYLNPRIQYSPKFKANNQVTRGLFECLERMVESDEESLKIAAQLVNFKFELSVFGSAVAKLARTETPVQWWNSYGSMYPELQKYAIRVLSLTCNSSGCKKCYNRSATEMVLTKRRNRLKQTAMNDLSLDDWIIDNDGNYENLDLDLDFVNEDDSVKVGDYASSDGGGGAPSDDLGIPNFYDDETDEDEYEDNMEQDDYYDRDLNDLLDIKS